MEYSVPLGVAGRGALECIARQTWRAVKVQSRFAGEQPRVAERVVIITDTDVVVISAIPVDLEKKLEVFGIYVDTISRDAVDPRAIEDARFRAFLGRRNQLRIVTRHVLMPASSASTVVVDDGLICRTSDGTELEIRADYSEPAAVRIEAPDALDVRSVEIVCG